MFRHQNRVTLAPPHRFTRLSASALALVWLPLLACTTVDTKLSCLNIDREFPAEQEIKLPYKASNGITLSATSGKMNIFSGPVLFPDGSTREVRQIFLQERLHVAPLGPASRPVLSWAYYSPASLIVATAKAGPIGTGYQRLNAKAFPHTKQEALQKERTQPKVGDILMLFPLGEVGIIELCS